MDIIEACRQGKLELVKKLYVESYIEDIDNLFIKSCEYGYIDIAKWLHSLGGVNIHAHEEEAFNLSCRYGHIDISKWLHSLGVDIHINNDSNFILSCEFGHIDIAKWLHSLGADVNAYAYGYNGFILSCAFGCIDVAKWLHSLGVNIHVDNEAAFTMSCRNGHIDIAKWLHSLGIDVNAYSHGYNGFILSCENNHIDIAKWLYSLGVDISINNYYPFRSSYGYGYTEVAKWLYNLDKKALIFYDRELDYDLIETDKDTARILYVISEQKTMPKIDGELDDVVLYQLIKYNLIDEIYKLQIPYLTIDVVDDKIVNWTIKRMCCKSANKSVLILTEI